MQMYADKARGLTVERLRQCLSYDAGTGAFARVGSGDVAGFVCKRSGYVRVKVDGHAYLAHRLAWLYVTGAWPSETIDHINGEKSDNKFANLREATHSQNKANAPIYRKRLKLPKGVFPNGNRYGSQIRFEKRRIYLGTYRTPEEAHGVYAQAAERLFGDFARAA